MKIEKHWLKAEDPSESLQLKPSKNAKELIDPDYLVIHYTATASSAINWFLTVQKPTKLQRKLIIEKFITSTNSLLRTIGLNSLTRK